MLSLPHKEVKRRYNHLWRTGGVEREGLRYIAKENQHITKTELKGCLKSKVKSDKTKRQAANQESLYYRRKDNRTLGTMIIMKHPLNSTSN